MGGQKVSAAVKVLHQRGGVHVALTSYDPYEHMTPHAHDFATVTLLLAGSFQEHSRTSEADLTTCARGLKGVGAVHANQFGPSGALLFTINIRGDELACDVEDGDWSWCAGQRLRDLVTDLRPLQRYHAAADEKERDDLTWDIYASLLSSSENAPALIPGWLKDARDRVREEEDAPAFSDLAREQGIHPASLSRAFRKAFGETLSTYRQKCRLGLAVSRLARGEGAAEAAYLAGFADQSHFTRIARRELGVTPGQLSALLSTC